MTRELLEELYARVTELETIISKELDREDPEMQVYGEARLGPCSAHAFEEDDERMKVIGQNGPTGEHYEVEYKNKQNGNTKEVQGESGRLSIYP